jgi:hypothetical protein
MEKLSPEQRHALTTFVKQIRELLRMCSHGGVPIEADEFMEQNLTPGRLLAVERLFQEPDDTTVSGYCGPVRFPGSVVQDCNPLMRELAARWIPYHKGDASPSDIAFLTPEQEKNEAFAFRKLNDYAATLERVLAVETQSDPATELRKIADRLRTIETANDSNASRYIKHHTAEACQIIEPHWQTLVSRAGIPWEGVAPFPAPEHRSPVDELEVWNVTWISLSDVISRALSKHRWPGMPHFTNVSNSDGVVVSFGTFKAEDWRERARDYADLIETVAEILTKEHNAPVKAKRVDALNLLRDAEDVLRFLQQLPADSTPKEKHWPTPFLFRSFFQCVERLAEHLRPISKGCPVAERGPVIVDGIAESDCPEFSAWAQSLENALREVCLERFGARFFFATNADTGKRSIYFESRELKAFSPSRAGLPDTTVADLAKLQAADIQTLKGYVSRLAKLVKKPGSELPAVQSISGTIPQADLPREWTQVIVWLQDLYCFNDEGALRIFRESEAAANFPALRNLGALWALLEAAGTIGPKRWGSFSIELPDSDVADSQWILPSAEDVRDIKPVIMSFAIEAVREMRKIVPAAKDLAAWNVSQTLGDILGWATYPDPKRLSMGWWDTYKANVQQVVGAATRSFHDEPEALQKLSETRSLAMKFLGLLYHNPTLSTVPVQDWPVKAYQRLFDDLSELEREFRIRGNEQLPTTVGGRNHESVVEPEAKSQTVGSLQPEIDRDGLAGTPKRLSSFREPQEWLRLRRLKGLSGSKNVWPSLRKRHGAEIDCESTKSARISFELAQEWGLDLPEFREPKPVNSQKK